MPEIKTKTGLRRVRLFLCAAVSLLGAPAFGLSLEEALKAAQEQHLDHAQALLNIQAAHERVEVSSSSRWPTLSASANAGISTNYPLSGEGEGNTNENYAANLRANYQLYDFGKTSAKISATQYQSQATEANLEAVDQSLAREIYLAYIDALRSKALHEQAILNRENAQAHLDESLTLQEIGRATAVDVLRLRARLKETETEIISAAGNYDIARLRLSVACGDNPAKYDFELSPFPNIDFSKFEAKPNPSIEALKSQATAQRKSASAAEDWLYPSLDLSASTGVSKSGDMPWGWSAQGSISLNFNFFDGFASSATAKVEAANARAAELNVEQAQQNLDKQVTNARLNLQVAEAKLESQQILVEEAESLLKLTEERMREGKDNALALQDAELSLRTAQTSQIRAEFARLEAQVEFAYAQGTLPTTL